MSYDIAAGETLGPVGESGSGKSVTALSIVRLLRAPGRVSGGHVGFKDLDLRALGEREMRAVRGKEIGFVFQEPMTALDPVYTVGAQIVEALRVHGVARGAAARARALELLEAVRIPNAAARLDDYPHQLSGGMRQRVCIAIAIACRPRLLIADEPTTALDVTIQAEILDLLRDMRRSLGLAMLLITHDLGVIAETADRVAVMYAGRIVEQAPVRDVLRDPQHPYTRGLLTSLPGGGRGDRLQPIDGAVPLLGAFPSGVPFTRAAATGSTCVTVVCRIRSARRPHGWCAASCTTLDTVMPRPQRQSPRKLMALVEFGRLTKQFARGGGLFGHRTTVSAVDDVSFSIEAGETFGLVGESGSGKTTTGRCVLRLIEPTSGSVRFAGEDMLAFSPQRLRAARRDMQIVLQDPYPSRNPRMRAREIVEEPLVIHGLGSRDERRERAADLFRLVGLDAAHLERYPHQFSGGQRQRIGLARALALHPKFVVLDEPVSALDVSVQAQVVNLLLDLQSRLQLTYLFIAHDLRLVEHICRRVAVMYRGRIVEMGQTGAIFASPRHPYTRTLLSAVPRLDPDQRPARAPLDPSTFDPRADLREVGTGHFAAV